MNFETEPISHWLFDPTVGKIISAIVGIFLIFVITKLSKRYIVNKIKDSENRYRAKKQQLFLAML
ncbi:hypothetical protein TAGGR_32 [Thermodesulfovibrio aggregans]|uniref:Mechanosensitive ion channel family protein n=1 Tax=Thermodesulfovibrio aggregans TaxID=86166 RepID=A0A0U9HUH7_9BACT|nr:hypothetical protein [Thermodesulfovibrio aggregans]GAQ95530.1 hypothetical protein TAGGR_32 [Thermodesulfovibrio aggregans]